MSHCNTWFFYKDNTTDKIVAQNDFDNNRCLKNLITSTTASHTYTQISSVFKQLRHVWGGLPLVSIQYSEREPKPQTERVPVMCLRRDTVLKQFRLKSKARSTKIRTTNLKSSYEDFFVIKKILQNVQDSSRVHNKQKGWRINIVKN